MGRVRAWGSRSDSPPSTAAPPVPDKVAWLHAEMLKTRLAHGFCARPKAAGPRPYANICEQCDFFVEDPQATAAITAQLEDVRALHPGRPSPRLERRSRPPPSASKTASNNTSTDYAANAQT